MDMREAEARLRELLEPTRQQVLLAKSWLSTVSDGELGSRQDVATLLREFPRMQGVKPPPDRGAVNVHDDGDVEGQLVGAAEYFNLLQAASQAIWESVSDGHLIWWGQVVEESPRVSYANRGTNGHWTVEDRLFSYPRHVRRAPAWDRQDQDAITSGYLVEAGLEHAHAEVQEAARDAVACLRRGLYRPGVVLLGKCMEGAWIEFGLAVAELASDIRTREAAQRLFRGTDGVGRKIREAKRLYDRDWAAPLRESSRVTPLEIESAMLWSDVVQDARNAIHFEALPSTANTYEKANVLFLAGARFLPMLYRVRDTARALRS